MDTQIGTRPQIGVVIYSKWGEEASDAIFDNVKPL